MATSAARATVAGSPWILATSLFATALFRSPSSAPGKMRTSSSGFPSARCSPSAAAPAEGAEPGEYRVVVVADGTWTSDLAMQPERLPANYQALIDIFAWLAQDNAMAGTVNSEEDVKIEHSKEGQGWFFYGTAFVAPLSLFGLGMIRIQLRRKNKGTVR